MSCQAKNKLIRVIAEGSKGVVCLDLYNTWSAFDLTRDNCSLQTGLNYAESAYVSNSRVHRKGSFII